MKHEPSSTTKQKMKYAEITSCSEKDKHIRIHYTRRLNWTYHFDTMSEEGFLMLMNNIRGTIDTLNNDNTIITRRNNTNNTFQVSSILETCMDSFKLHPIEIKDFERFANFISEKYFEHLRYYQEVLEHVDLSTDTYFDSAQLTQTKTTDFLTETLESINTTQQ